MIAAGLTLLAFFALAAAMPRHAATLLGGWERRVPVRSLRAAGWLLLALSLVVSLRQPDGGLAVVRWFGLLPFAATWVLLGLTYDIRLARAAAAAGILASLLGAAT